MVNAQSNSTAEEANKTGDTERAQTVKADVEEIAQIARDAAYDKVTELGQMGKEQARALKGIVEDEPLKALAISAGVGFALGLLLTRHNG